MRFTSAIVALGGVAIAQAATVPAAAPAAKGGPGLCPAIWKTIATQLTAVFVDPTTGQCTALARGAIRFAFHDAATWDTSVPPFGAASGGADASLLLVPSEINRPENNGLQPYYDFLTSFYANFTGQVGAADLVYFAGNAAIVLCPGGPAVTTLVGRGDSDGVTPSTEGLMPPAFGPGSDATSLVALFAAKGFGTTDLAALVGAHTVSTAVGQAPNVPVGGAQDDTPGIWDVDFYANTYNPPPNVFRFDSDINLSNTSIPVGVAFNGFVGHLPKWQVQFAQAMKTLTLLGIPSTKVATLVDCTASLPAAGTTGGGGAPGGPGH